MSDAALRGLARAAGLSVAWTDADGVRRKVSPDTLRAVLEALGLAVSGPRQIADSRAGLHNARKAISTATGTRTAFGIREATGGRKVWGVAAQLYGLRGGTTAGFGDFAALETFAARAAQSGAAAVALSPVHALFAANPSHFSPYAPSTRLFLNPLYAPLPRAMRKGDETALIDWPRAGASKLRALYRFYENWKRRPSDEPGFRRFIRDGGDALLAHARFEVLHARFHERGLDDWRDWPAEFRNPKSPHVRKLHTDDDMVRFHLFLQWIADAGLARAHARARAAGMAIGLMSDLAVGVDPAGSQAWSAPEQMLGGLSLGAPPDDFNDQGQNWGLTAFSPLGLRAGGYDSFAATLRATMRHAGAMRLDHAMSLQRLWVIPKGAQAIEGVYLNYPLCDLLHLLATESRRHRCVVIGEDLGTVSAHFRAQLSRAGMLGMRVMWFERDAHGGFIPPEAWGRMAAAFSTTHDLPTIAGWWRGRDIAWRKRAWPDGVNVSAARSARAHDRAVLWRMLSAASDRQAAQPSAGRPAAVTDAAMIALGRAQCPLTIVPVEDLLGASEQPNLPGTIDTHPNWRRRLADADPFAQRQVKRRANILNRERQR